MSSHSFPKIDQKEYLKKYLSGDKVKKKKKDKKHEKSSSAAKVKIIDDDINHLDQGPEIDEELLLTGEDAPQIVGEYIEENPSDNVPKWKKFDAIEEHDSDLWGRKAEQVSIKQEFSKKRPNRTPDNSPPRRRERKRSLSSTSPARNRRDSTSPQRKSKRDKSPARRRKNEESSDVRRKIKMEPKSSPHRKHEQSPLQRHRVREDLFDRSHARRRDTDQSPPRKGKSSTRRYSDCSPPNRNKSPTRNNRRHTPVHSPPRRKRNPDRSPSRRCSLNQSPPRLGKSLDQSPARRRRNSYQSPPKRSKGQKRHSPDKSKSRRGKSPRSPVRHKRNSDLSPPRKHKIRSPDLSPPRKRRDSDQSPPRKNRNSPSMSRKHSSDQYLPRRPLKNSPPAYTKKEKFSASLSPPPTRRSRWERQETERSFSPPPTHETKPGKTLEGKRAGLQNAQSLRKETQERRRKEDILFEKMSSDVSGRHAEVQVRSTGRKGRRAREAAEEDPEERRRKEEHEEKKKQLYDRWGKGLKQIEDHENRLLEQQYESSKPLARYANDEDLEKHLREQERADDPMLQYMRQKRKEKEKQSGKPQIPRYEGSFPENRFGIRPGYRWDGVDRSNGYEKKYFAVQNEKRAVKDEAYKYSVEDM